MTKENSNAPIIMWFRQDLRIHDNPALNHAASSGKPIVAVFIHDEISPNIRPMGAAQKWWLHHSLVSHANELKTRGCKLILKSGAATDAIAQLKTETGADAICWNRRYGDGEQSVDADIKQMFKDEGLEAKSFAGHLMHEPSLVRTGSDMPYRVYTPFWKKFCEMGPPRAPYPAPEKLKPHQGQVSSDTLEDWKFLPTKPDWSKTIAEQWTPGEPAATERAKAYMAADLRAYDSARDLPGPDRTSKLSPHLRFGEISPYTLWHQCHDQRHTADAKAREVWAKELVWREFSYHLLQEWPHLRSENFNPKFDNFPWDKNEAALEAWKRGQTGYPIVDAGMRQLWKTGWMHNRVRMIVGSFLVKHLLLDWREGERWFWDTLVDGDPAANPAQWQWVAGTGADAAPYFRIFNPILQAEKFDKDGSYIKRYVPELSDLPAQFLAAPWDAPAAELKKAGIVLGETYPKPIVDHKEARERALAALQASKEPKE
jgi:deoxyribodipyrimidine photo-lyase